MRLLEGRALERPYCVEALTSGASRDIAMGYHVCYTVSGRTFIHLRG